MSRMLSRVPILVVFFSLLLIYFPSCERNAKEQKQPSTSSAAVAAAAPAVTPPANDAQGLLDLEESTPTDPRLSLPANFGRWTGDWGQIRKHNVLRMLVVYSKTSFFYDRGRPSGMDAEVARELELYINKKLKTPARRFHVAIIPVTTGQLLPYLNNGMGDFIAAHVFATPERAKIVDFTKPIMTDERLIVVTNKKVPPVASVGDLSGRKVVVNKVRLSYELLQEENQKLKGTGKPEIDLVESDSALQEEDLLQMTNAGLTPATACWERNAEVWSSVLPNLRLNTTAVLKDAGNIAWAMRKNSPQLKALLDGFVKTHREDTVFGRIMAKRYLSAKAIKDSTSQQELRKFNLYVKYFQKYSEQYDFDYLMIAAQGYQESMLRQDLVSRRGAVGIMQVMPKIAAAQPIGIRNVREAEQNIQAGTKMLAYIAKTYFNDPGLDRTNKTLFTFAAYNAGPSRIVRLRAKAKKQGLNQNKWFGNVELVAAKDIGRESVQYVSNIYKYYVAYKMAKDQQMIRAEAMGPAEGR
jgi:membrane-bound lytic murein transglycosylase MltF